MSTTPDAWKNLKTCIIDQIDALIRYPYSSDVVYCLNVHNEGKKVKYTRHDRVDSSIWQSWLKDVYFDDKFANEFNETQQPLDEYTQIQLINEDIQNDQEEEQRE